MVMHQNEALIGFSQKKLREKDILFFLHIPKTAGSAVFDAVKKKYQQQQILDLSDDEFPVAFDCTYSSAKMAQITLVRQHQDYSFKSFFPRDPHIFTMLREPITRVLSFYKHVCRVPSHGLHKLVTEKNLGVIDLLTIAPSIEVKNTQMKYLCGFKIAMDDRFSDIEKLEVARMNLRKLACFGITEEFLLSMNILKWTFGWDTLDWQVVNQSPEVTSIESLSGSEKDLLIEYNQLDIDLYEYAKSLFFTRARVLLDEGVRV